ncbi:feline leukemia virus subgroup C receptor-related protein 2-like [Toxorhynchites rutilus septentrionalis]|uniref:feline leukemia virus subgroup C receptor-related protein 2-like n=1 Tax=Toxorhynchites rutilus septentrionalis TaxID=329112 RepID=UPI0024791DF6|nr:feline leukemia virus subgroup C receptor-related protein 2-like [Toxorhynchites rutilus septentrionalis]
MRTEQIFTEKSLLVQSLKISNNLDRKKSLSTSIIPTQNQNFLCVPLLHNGLHHPKSVEVEGNHGFQDIVIHSEVGSSYQSMTRSISQSTLTIPENYSFTSVHIKVYKRRWVMLVLGMMSIAISYVQWIQYSIVANIIVRYYDISSTWVDWTSMIFMVVYVVFVFPISYLMDTRNLRQTAVIGSVGTAIGAWIKVFSADREQFQLVLVGQTISAISQVFLLSIPSRLASTWFAPEEASSVCAFGVFAAQLGIAAGFFFTPIVIINHDDLTQTGVELKIFLMAVAGISTVIACMVLAVFKSAPQFAPSHVQAIQRTMKLKREDYWPAVGRLMQHDNFLILVIAYGINVGIFNAFSTLLNQIVVNYFPTGEADAGRIGLGLIVLGLVGSMVFGYLLDTMHKYKATAIWACRLSALTLVIFALALESRSKKLVSVASVFLGFFMTGFQPIGYEFAAELTFPEPDGPVSGMLNISTQIFGIAVTLLISGLQQFLGDFFGNMVFAAFLVIDAHIISLIKSELRRFNTHLEIQNEAAKEYAEDACTHFENYSCDDVPLKLRIDDCSS